MEKLGYGTLQLASTISLFYYFALFFLSVTATTTTTFIVQKVAFMNLQEKFKMFGDEIIERIF